MRGELIELAAQCPHARGFESGVLDVLQRQVGFDVAFLSVRGAESQPTVHSLSAEMVAHAVARGPAYQQDLLPVKQAALSARGVAIDTRVLGVRGVQRTAYYRELGRRVGEAHSQLMAYVPLRGQWVAALMLGRARPTFSDADVSKLESLLPELGVARGSYGLPVCFEPLEPRARSWWARRGAGWRTQRLASVRLERFTLEVRDRAGFREMVAVTPGAELVWTRAALQDPTQSGWPYVELLQLAAVQARGRQRALFIGCGGAVALRQFASVYPGIELDLAESEPAVIELARQWFALDAIPNLRVHVQEGVRFLQRAEAHSWQILVVDAFDASEHTSAWAQPAFVAAAQRALAVGGALAINLIGTLDGTGPVPDVVQALSTRFERVRVLPVLVAQETLEPSALRNVVVVASRRE